MIKRKDCFKCKYWKKYYNSNDYYCELGHCKLNGTKKGDKTWRKPY